MLTPVDLLEEHLPPGISILIVGPPGSGKTILSQQLVYHTLQRDGSAIYIASRGQISQILSQQKLFNWDISSYLKNRQFSTMEIGDVADPTDLNISLSRTVDATRLPLSLVVIDSLTVLMVGMEQKRIMKFTEGLARKLQDQNIGLILLITPTKETEDFLTKMKSLISSVIEIELREEETIRRFMRIFKFLGQRHSTLWYSFDITGKGIKFAASSIRTPETFLFGLDGTLVTVDVARRDIDTFLKEKGCPEELLENVPVREAIQNAVTYLRDHWQDWEEVKKEAELLLEKAEIEAAPKAVLIEGAQSVLKILKEKKKKVGIITQSSMEAAMHILKKCELDLYVDFLFTKDMESKNVDQVMKELSSPERTVIVGDHSSEIEAGNKAGYFTVGVLTGWGTRKTLKNANVILNSVKDLEEILTTA